MPRTPKQMERLILADGWEFKRQKGSHKHYQHPIKKGLVTIPFHNKNLPIMTERSILKQAGLNK